MNSEEGPAPASFEVARAIAKKTFADREPQYPVVAETYKEVSTKKDGNRRNACLLAQLRSCQGTACNYMSSIGNT